MKFKVNHKRQKKTVYRGGTSRRSIGRSQKREKKGRWIALIIVAVLMLGAAGGAAFIAFEVNGSGAQTQGEIVINVPEGASTGEIADILKDNGLIGHPAIFKLYSKLTGADGTFQHGSHTLTGGDSYDQIIEELKKTTQLVVETVRVTFPEGTTALKMAMLLKEQGLIETLEEFINSCNNDTFDVSFFSQISDHSLKFIKLEGFLYPDTYDFEVGSSVQDIILVMLRNFETKVFTDSISANLANSQYSLEEIVILASIIQKESLNGEEYNISAVFNNRLVSDRTGRRLESCTTGDAGRPFIGGFIPNVLGYYYGGMDHIPAGMAAAYDTYNTPGLPVGAIGNPEAKMIDAALNPTPDFPYYFFFTDPNNVFHYSATYAEHERKQGEFGVKQQG